MSGVTGEAQYVSIATIDCVTSLKYETLGVDLKTSSSPSAGCMVFSCGLPTCFNGMPVLVG